MPFKKGRAANPGGAGGFKRGQSGNPGGRPKDFSEFRELIRQKGSRKAVRTLLANLRDPDGHVSTRAAEMILAYSWGRPPQAIEVTGKEGGPIEVIQRAATEALETLVAATSGDDAEDEAPNPPP